MDFKITIDKNDNMPIYRQLIEQIMLAIKNGTLKSGDKLPPERELASSINIARGTIKKAYEELENNKVVQLIQGKGTFVSHEQDVLTKDRKTHAIKLIDDMLAGLEALNFSYREISILTNIRIMEHEKELVKVRVAAVDCNPEALSIFESQLSYISNIVFSKFLLDEINRFSDHESIFKDFDIILTTSTHYSQLQTMLTSSGDKVMQAAVSPSQQTIIDIAKISTGASVGIVCRSRQFLDIIKNILKSFKIDLKSVTHVFEGECAEFDKFLEGKGVLVVPPDFNIEVVEPFIKNGGKVVKFEYQIERGSLIYIEEQISAILRRK